MHPEIEKLIDFAVTDGQITEKERNVILKKAAEFSVDADEVEMVLDAKLHQLGANKPKEKVGNIKTCPACGSSVPSFTAKCSDCGHEYRHTKSSTTLVEFQKGLNNIIEEERGKIDRTEGRGIFANDRLIISDQLAQKATYERQALFITSYPVPNNKEDLIEFLSLTMSEALKPIPNVGATHIDYPKVALINAWKTKANQIIFKSKIVFENDNQALKIIEDYERAFQEQNLKTNKFRIPKFILFFAVIILLLIIGRIITTNGRKIEQERLEKIENQISNQISNHLYDQALLLCNQLYWQHSTNWDRNDQKHISTWDHRREALKTTIERIKKSK